MPFNFFKYLLILSFITIITCHELVETKVSQIRFAICLNGQLVRLELGSKIKNLINYNLKKGFHISLFVLLDNDVSHLKGAKDKFRIKKKDSLYSKFDNDSMTSLIKHYITKKATEEDFKLYVRLEPPLQNRFLVKSGKPPVGPVASLRRAPAAIRYKNAFERVQSHFRWQSGLRECVKWVQDVEFKTRSFFDFVMRYYSNLL